MKEYEFFNSLDNIIDETKSGVLSTIGLDGGPKMRWLTPSTLKNRQGCIYTVAAKDSNKVEEILLDPKVEWMFQSRSLARIINIKGYINVLDNPSITNEIIETIGKRLSVFWKVNLDKTELVVLETVFKEATYFEPMKAKKHKFHFREENCNG